MTKKIFILFIILPLTLILSWGREGHFLIARYAVQNLPKEMEYFKQWEDYIVKHSIDADNRKEIVGEDVKHFIDIDFYEEYFSGSVIHDKNQLVKKYGDSIVNSTGVLPWATVTTYDNLVQAFKEKNRDKVLILASDLAHYVADGHQPMHTILNYDGQLSGQKGIHKRYETEMVERYKDEIVNSGLKDSLNIISNPLEFVFNYIIESNSYDPVIFSADNFAYQYTGSRKSEDYYKLLWFKTKHVTFNRINAASNALSVLYYSAWASAGKPNLKEIN